MATEIPSASDPIAEAERQWIEHGWSDAAPGVALVASIMRVQQIYSVRAERTLRPLNLSFARYELLMVLHFSREGRLPLGKLSARLQVQPGAVTNAVRRLERDGYIERCTHPLDARTTLAVLSLAGRQLAVQATLALNVAVHQSTGVNEADSRELSRLLRLIRKSEGDF